MADKIILKIKEYRKQAGLTQAQLAVLIGAMQKQVSSWENGVNEPSISTLKEIAKVLNCTMDDLVQ